MSETPATDPQRQTILIVGLFVLVVVSLGVGFLIGFFVRGGAAPVPAMAASTLAPGPAPGGAAPAAPAPAGGDPAHHAATPGTEGHTAGPGGTVACAFDLPQKDQWMLAGMTCNCTEANCNRTPLLSCHCNSAHAMKALAKQMIVEGRSAAEIAAELQKKFGDGIVPATPPKPPKAPAAG
ncbi:MAG TPA: hypothetical protein VFQ07_11930 [Candidatus Polarisedimenticolia bacterium]|nr:hypothetical protein [Candidatus Polarisedimenticolia bacterium]